MTLARKIYKQMKIGKEYRMADLLEMMYKAEREYMDSNPDIDEALNEEWLGAVQSSNLPQRIRDALKITREFGYTEVIINTTPMHNVTCNIRCVGKWGIGYTRKKTYHYDEFKDFIYRRIK
jgi:hypothetical protein